MIGAPALGGCDVLGRKANTHEATERNKSVTALKLSDVSHKDNGWSWWALKINPNATVDVTRQRYVMLSSVDKKAV
jgi:hypothetical protein